MMPTRIRLTMLFNRELKARMRSKTRKAPAKAAIVTPTVDQPGMALTAIPLSFPVSSTTMATPRLAPLEIPKIDGSAKGFRKSVCISKPETERPIPANRAVMACGRRYSRMMVRNVSSPPPVTTFQNSERGTLTLPTTRLSTKSNSPANKISRVGSQARVVILASIGRQR